MTTICLPFRQILTLVAMATCLSLLQAQDETPLPAVKLPTIEGKTAPEIEIDTWINLPNGKEKLTIEDFKGKVLVMMFFLAEGDGIEEGRDVAFATLKEMTTHFNGNDKVGFIACLTPWRWLPDNTDAKLKPMSEKYQLEIPFGHCTSTEPRPGMVRVGGSYHVLEMPWFVVVGPDGIVKFSGNVNNIAPGTAIEKITEMIK